MIMPVKDIVEPTGAQCDSQALVYETEHEVGYAMWYPQMGGYVGKSVVVFTKGWTEDESGGVDSCFAAYVWHDGEFPFSASSLRNPANIHHCSPSQFSRFGHDVERLRAKYRKGPGRPVTPTADYVAGWRACLKRMRENDAMQFTDCGGEMDVEFNIPELPPNHPAPSAEGFYVGQVLKGRHGPHDVYFEVVELGADGKPNRSSLLCDNIKPPKEG